MLIRLPNIFPVLILVALLPIAGYAYSGYNIGNTPGYDSLKHIQSLEFIAKGRYSEAKSVLLQLLSTTNSESKEYAWLLSDLAFIYYQKREYNIALDLLENADAIVSDISGIQNDIHFTDLKFRKASSDAHLENNLAAIIGFNQVRLIYETSYGFNDPRTIDIILQIAGIYNSIGDFRKAFDIYTEVDGLIGLNPEANRQNEVTNLQGQAMYFSQTGNFAEALNLQKIVLSKIEEDVGNESDLYVAAEGFLGKFYLQNNQTDSAFLVLDEALKREARVFGKYNRHYLNSVLVMADLEWEKGRFNEAGLLYAQVFDEYIRQYNRFSIIWSIQENTAMFNQIGIMLEKFTTLIEETENQEELASHLLKFKIIFNELVLQHNKINEKYKNDKNFLTLRNGLEELYYLYNQPVSAIPGGIGEIRKDEKFVDKIKQSFLKKAGITPEEFGVFIPDPLDIKNVLEPGQAAVEILRYRHYSPHSGGKFLDSLHYAFIIYDNSEKAPQVAIVKHGNLLENKYLTYFRSGIKHRFADDYSYEMYWGPVKKYFDAYDRIVISPDGAFRQINLLTLRNTQTEEFLNDEKHIRRVGSTSDLLLIKKNGKDQKREVFIFGNAKPHLPGNNYNVKRDYLFFSSEVSESGMSGMREKLKQHTQWNELLYDNELKGHEIDLLQSLYESMGLSIHMFSGELSVEGKIKELVNPFTLHLSLHGFFMEDDEHNPELFQDNLLLHSGLLFSGSQDYLDGNFLPSTLNDGVLTAFEIANLQLDGTELVFLSSCETGLGIVQNAHAIEQVERAFLHAGAKSVIMSMWTTEAEYEIEFMNMFYFYWLLENKSKREAFDKAQDHMKQTYGRTYYWGSFIFIGE